MKGVVREWIGMRSLPIMPSLNDEAFSTGLGKGMKPFYTWGMPVALSN